MASVLKRNQLPQYYGSGQTQDRANINTLLSGQFNPTETLTNAAELNVAAGVPGSNFGMGTATKLLESEKLARQQLGHQMLQPYLNRDFEASQAAANREGQLQAIAAEGASALQRLQLQEAGASARQTSEQNTALQRQVIAGQQAMEQLRAGQAGDIARTREQIAGNLASTKLGITGSLLERYLSRAGLTSPQQYRNDFNPATGITTAVAIPNTGRTTGVSSTHAIDGILRRYGLL